MNDQESIFVNMGTIECPGCGRHDFRFRRKTKDYQCRNCGTTFELYLEDEVVKTRIKEQPI